jgi:hypothetical protein
MPAFLEVSDLSGPRSRCITTLSTCAESAGYIGLSLPASSGRVTEMRSACDRGHQRSDTYGVGAAMSHLGCPANDLVQWTNQGGVMRVIWRFFVGEDARWRWQQLTVDRAVVAESRSSYEKYERCLAAAQAKGYIFEAAQDRLPRPGNRIYSRP